MKTGFSIFPVFPVIMMALSIFHARFMFATQRFSLFSWLCEGAGVAGILAMLLACSLAYSGSPATWVWICLALSAACNLIYIAYILAQRVTGNSSMNWRELLLATLVPVAAVAVTIILAGELAGLWHLPFVGSNGTLI